MGPEAWVKGEEEPAPGRAFPASDPILSPFGLTTGLRQGLGSSQLGLWGSRSL